jgi:hypothetical protein
VKVDDGQADLQGQLVVIGGRVWSYSMWSNCYSACLDALVKIKADEVQILEYVQHHIGLGPDELIDSLKALKALDSDEASDLMKRAVAFWMPKLNKGQTKKVLAVMGKR